MVAEAIQSLRATLATDLMWTWSGIHFGYRRGNSLFTHDGIEVGRFSGLEIFDTDGRYLGEVRRTVDGDRLITSTNKKFHTAAVFAPTLDRPHKKAPDRMALPLYCGYEHFPAPELVRSISLLGT